MAKAHDATLAQFAGWQAMIWRYHAEAGFHSIATSASLVKAAALLDELAGHYPEADRFQLHFKLTIDKPDPGFGPATLTFMGWHFQRSFADSYGRLRGDVDQAAFAQVRQAIEKPQTAEFFRLFGTDTTMLGVAATLYELACGRDPEPVVAEIIPPFGIEAKKDLEKSLKLLRCRRQSHGFA